VTPASAKPARRARGSMSAAEILDTAKRLIERDGIRRLSMPLLAKELGSGVTSIYWYFRSKDDLLEALTAEVLRDMHRQLPPVGDGPWEDELLAYFVAFRDLLEAYPVYREINAGRPHLQFVQPTKAMLERLEAGLSLLVRAGLTPEQATAAFTACTNFARGHVALQHGVDREVRLASEDRLVRLEDFPTLSAMHPTVDELVPLDEDHFVLGLRLMIVGIRQTYLAGPTTG
jgi:AcrR family transcriptional regulator